MPNKVAPPNRLPSDEHKIALAFAECFSTPSGQLVLAYLRKSLVQTIMPAATPSNELVYREGQRSVVGICDLMIQKAKHEPASDPSDLRPRARTGRRSPG